ncbi:PEP-CTERM sorting domain-containing protein [Paracraurococcus ruber]|uniref:Ice-binding protein C-terminal domain-containing protein n=1 Tax=Paracraurococcus ruber TaxID=77675 RepID=A0ABS1CX15_9PROT|nr:PEP-CTERM sorting domain-containing protein [Paracraurococcus ruber]MBK1658279.1 hypothetical protein [Paracraurococcus ruber]TDG31016.1 PEP-CTERM sorting domain-containing protein [Paracraurococcus ruber]
MRIAPLLAVILVTGLPLGGAGAAPVGGTGSVMLVGLSTDASLIGPGTLFSSPGLALLASGSGDFAGLDGQALNLGPVVLGGIATFSAGFGSFLGQVSAASLLLGGDPAERRVTILAIGQFVPAGALGGFDPVAMTATFAFIQPAAGGEVSGTLSIVAPPPLPPPIPVPEPRSLLLFGLALAGLGIAAVRRR